MSNAAPRPAHALMLSREYPWVRLEKSSARRSYTPIGTASASRRVCSNRGASWVRSADSPGAW